jgi:hypothetical protein
MLCGLEDDLVPSVAGNQVLLEYQYQNVTTLPDYVVKYQSTARRYVTDNVVFEGMKDQVYDAYDRDVAVVRFFFESPTVFQFVRQPSMTWVAFLSQVGGLLGLCLGFSVASGIELGYWFLYRLWFSASRREKEEGDQKA